MKKLTIEEKNEITSALYNRVELMKENIAILKKNGN